MSHDSPVTSFLTPKFMAKFERDHPLWGRQMQVGWVKFGHFRRKTRYNSKIVRNRRIICTPAIGPQNSSIFAFFVAFHIFVVSKRRDFILVYRLIVTINRP